MSNDLWRGFLLRADPDGTRHLLLFTDNRIIELVPNASGLARLRGWYSTDLEPVPGPFEDLPHMTDLPTPAGPPS